MPTVDAIIEAGWILPVAPCNIALKDHVLTIKNGKIHTLLAKKEMAKRAFTANTHLKLPNHVLMPGLVNAHTHSAMSLLRGIADDIPLMDWLNHHIWPTERECLSADFVEDGTRLACAEMLLGGTTCFNDHYFYADQSAKVAQSLGMRCRIGLFMIDHPTPYAKDFSAYVEHELAWYHRMKAHPLVSVSLAPHSPYALGDASMQTLKTLKQELACPIHMHVHESELEVTQSLRDHGKRPLRRLADLGLLEPDFHAVHCAQMTTEDLQVIQDHGISIIHCPQSNAKMASGICPVNALIDRGINVGLGTDGAASNNDLNMLGEMQSAAFLAKQQGQDPRRLPAAQVIAMATLHGAKAIGLDHCIGSLEPGKAADLIAIDMLHPATQPLYEPMSQVVYACGREQVSHVWVNGKLLVENRHFTQLPIAEIMRHTQRWGERIGNHHTCQKPSAA